MEISINKKDIFWSYSSIFLTLASNVLTIPIIIYFLDGDMLGLWYVFLSVGAIANLFDFGFTVTFARNITYCWSGAKKIRGYGIEFSTDNTTDFQLMYSILYVCKKIFLLVSFVVLVLLLIPGTLYINHISTNIDDSSYLYAWFIYSSATFLNIYYNYYDAFLRGVGAIKIAYQNRVIAKFTQIILIVLFLLLGYGIVGMALAYFIFGIIFRLLGNKRFYSYKKIGAQIEKFKYNHKWNKEKHLFLSIWRNAWREGLIQLSFYLTEQVSVIICSFYLSLQETGEYSLMLQIATAVATISTTLYTVYQPSLQASCTRNDKNESGKVMSIIVVSYVLSFLVLSICTIFIGLPIIHLIKPQIHISILLATLIFLSQFVVKFRNCYTSYYSSLNRIDYMTAFILSSILSLLLSIVFIGELKFGVYGLICGQILSQVVYNLWYWPLQVHKDLNLSPTKLFNNALLYLKRK